MGPPDITVGHETSLEAVKDDPPVETELEKLSVDSTSCD